MTHEVEFFLGTNSQVQLSAMAPAKQLNRVWYEIPGTVLNSLLLVVHVHLNQHETSDASVWQQRTATYRIYQKIL